MIKKRLTASMMSLALAVTMIPVNIMAASEDVIIDAKNFPDPEFRAVISDVYDLNHNGKLAMNEIDAATEMVILDGGITDLTGLQLFYNLNDLLCGDNDIKKLDLSGNTKLTYLDCRDCGLTSLDLSVCPQLTTVFCGLNELTKLDISKNTELRHLDCRYNKITSLDLTNNTHLEEISCQGNGLKSLNVKGLNRLTVLDIAENSIKTLDISGCYYLVELCENYELTKDDTTCYYSESIDSPDESEVVAQCDFEYDVNVEVTYDLSVSMTTPTPIPVTATPLPTANPLPTLPPSEMSVEDFVKRCYKVALSREPDAEGMKGWAEQLNDGKSCGAQVGYGFIFSSEYLAKNTDNETFVKDLYSMFFGREPDEAGFESWVEQLGNGVSREEVFAGFANSEEFYNLCSKYGVVSGIYIPKMSIEQQSGVNCFIARLYRVCLTRLPDQGGQSGWVKKLIDGEVSGTTAAHGFIFSPEFTKLELSDVNFVSYMYIAFFGRVASQQEIVDWASQLAENSIDREDVFAGFAGSIEFDALCNSYGIIR